MKFYTDINKAITEAKRRRSQYKRSYCLYQEGHLIYVGPENPDRNMVSWPHENPMMTVGFV